MGKVFTHASVMLYKKDTVLFSMDRLAESNDLFQLFRTAVMSGVAAPDDAAELNRQVRILQGLLTERFLHGIMADLLDNNRLRPTAPKTALRAGLGLADAAASGAAAASRAAGAGVSHRKRKAPEAEAAAPAASVGVAPPARKLAARGEKKAAAAEAAAAAGAARHLMPLSPQPHVASDGGMEHLQASTSADAAVSELPGPPVPFGSSGRAPGKRVVQATKRFRE